MDSGGVPIVKIVVVGDAAVGKSSTMCRFTDEDFTLDQMPTIGLDLRQKRLVRGGFAVNLQIWDTAGQEVLRILPSIFYKGAKGVILSFDCTSRKSFESTHKWRSDISAHTDLSTVLVLAATKSDLTEQRTVLTAEAESFALELGVKYFETSAFTGTNIENMFNYLLDEILRNSNPQNNTGRMSLRDSRTVKNKCCSAQKQAISEREYR